MADTVVIGDLVAKTGRRAVELARAVESAGLEWVIDGVPTTTLNATDRGWRLLRDAAPVLDADRDGRLDGSITARIAGRQFVMSGISKDDGGEGIKLAHWLPVLMDTFDSPRSAPAGSMRRMQFLSGMARECGVEAVLLDPDVRRGPPGIASERPKDFERGTAARDRARAKGFAPGVRLKIQGAEATPEQLRVLSVALAVCDERRSPERAVLAAIAGGIVESKCRNLEDGDADSEGWLQARVRLHGRDLARSVRRSTVKFLETGFAGGKGAEELARTRPSMTPAQIAAACLAPREDLRGRYQTKDGHDIAAAARAILDAWGGSTSGSTDGEQAPTFARGSAGEREGSWTAGARLATDRAWRWCVAPDGSRDVLLCGPDDLLMLGRPAATIREGDPGVERIRWDADARSNVRVMKVEVRADVDTLLGLAARTVVVDGEGPIARGRDGRWLVTGLTVAAVGDQRGTIELQQPVKAKAEPRVQVSGASLSGSRADAFEDERIRKARRRADEITRKGYLYSWGGGHDANFTGPYDCSGAVSAVLHAAGLLDAPLTTSGLVKWGQAGEGKALTVWVKETSDARQSHCYMTFKTRGGDLRVFESGDRSARKTGWRPGGTHPRSGFAARHWEGL